MKYLLIMMWVFNVGQNPSPHPIHGDYYQVEFATLEQCEKAIKAMNGYAIDYRVDRISICVERGLPK